MRVRERAKKSREKERKREEQMREERENLQMQRSIATFSILRVSLHSEMHKATWVIPHAFTTSMYLPSHHSSVDQLPQAGNNSYEWAARAVGWQCSLVLRRRIIMNCKRCTHEQNRHSHTIRL